MDQAKKTDQDDVLRAQAILLESGRLHPRREADACRVLAEVDPTAYLPRLCRALLMLSYLTPREYPEACLAATAEAADAARRLDAAHPRRSRELLKALGAHKRSLYRAGRRQEGLAVLEEMERVGRRAYEEGQEVSFAFWLSPLAVGLAEEGRHEEAAALLAEVVGAQEHGTPSADAREDDIVSWAAELEAAGRPDAALGAFAHVVEHRRSRLASDGTPLNTVVWTLLHFAEMLDARGRRADARATRREAGVLLAELADTGERKRWSGHGDDWRLLLQWSGRADELPRPGRPVPAVSAGRWSTPDLRNAYAEGCAELRERAAGLAERAAADPRAHLGALITVHRRLTVRRALTDPPCSDDRCAQGAPRLFHEGVALGERAAEAGIEGGATLLARALLDRVGFLLTLQRCQEAYADFRRACEMLDDDAGADTSS